MRLNKLQPALGSKRTRCRVGRGTGSGKGKTAGRGAKGQRARTGGRRDYSGFEGGQMPLQRRVPKFGFNSRKALVRAKIRLGELNQVENAVVDLAALKAANVITVNIKHVKIFLSGKINKAITVRGLGVTQNVRAAIEAAGGKIENSTV